MHHIIIKETGFKVQKLRNYTANKNDFKHSNNFLRVGYHTQINIKEIYKLMYVKIW